MTPKKTNPIAARAWITLAAATLFSAAPALAAEPPAVEPPIASGEVSSRDIAVVIGNEAYHGLPQAQWAAVDARSFRDWLTTARGVSPYRTTYLENVDRKTIDKYVKKLRRKVKKDGTVWIYFSGHGVTLPDGRRALIPIDATGASVAAEAMPLESLYADFLDNKQVRRVVVVVDAGFGTRSRDGFELLPGTTAVTPGPMPASDPRLVVWVADEGLGPNQVYPAVKHGLFTWTVLGGLRGWADGVVGEKDGKVSLYEAQVFASDAIAMLGRVGMPSIDARPAVQDIPMAQGAGLEAFPGADLFEALADEDARVRFQAHEDRVRSDAEAFWQDTLAMVKGGGPQGRAALEAYISEFQAATVKVERRVYLPQVSDARRMLDAYSESAPPPPPPVTRTDGGAAPVASASCDDLVALEASAMLGELGAGAIACLERRIVSERIQTTRNKISRLLIVDAESRKDLAEWERFVQRHLEDIDRSDPDLCMRYAVHLHKSGGVDLAEDAIRWSGYALENKHVWETKDYVKKVSGLHRLRAEAAHRLWVDAERIYASEPNPETDRMTREYRGMAKSYSREWLDFVRAAGLETERAYQMCLTASGAEMFCAAE